MFLELGGVEPLYQQVYRGLRAEILDGSLPAGSRLPSSRALALQLGVSRNVVTLAYEQLVLEGYTEARVGAGTFVTSPLPESMLHSERRAPTSTRGTRIRLAAYGRRALEQYDAVGQPTARRCPYDFRYGLTVPDALTLRSWKRLVTQVSDVRPLDYDAAEGLLGLRQALVHYLHRTRGLRCDVSQVLVVSGSQQALDLASRVLLEPRDRVLIEEPHYHGARRAFLAAGAQLIPCPIDAEGMDVSRAPRGSRAARLAYVTPSHQFPSGAVMPLARRLELLQWAARNDAFLIEDDYDSEFRYEGRPIEAVQALDRDGRVLYVGTFSKILFPSMRLGFVVVPYELRDAFVSAKWLADRHTPVLEQAVLAAFFEGGDFERHVRRMRKRCASRRQALLRAIQRHLGSRADVVGTAAGVHLLVWLRRFRRQRLPDLLTRAAARGVGVYPVDPCYLKPPAGAGLLLGYAALNERRIGEGIRRLAAALDELDAS